MYLIQTTADGRRWTALGGSYQTRDEAERTIERYRAAEPTPRPGQRRAPSWRPRRYRVAERP